MWNKNEARKPAPVRVQRFENGRLVEEYETIPEACPFCDRLMSQREARMQGLCNVCSGTTAIDVQGVQP
jgi:hypothetical protein